MKYKNLPLSGAAEIFTEPAEDSRGWFARMFCQKELSELNFGRQIQQVNCSFTKLRGTIRGLHFQHPPYAEDRIVRCIFGRVFDVMVDLRRSSPTFGRWHSVILNSSEMNMVYIPSGFAHGFQTLEDNCQMLYLHTEFHTPHAERGIRHDSQLLDIRWPLNLTMISIRDKELPNFDPQTGGL